MMLWKSLMIICLFTTICWLGCQKSTSDEPPFIFGEGKPGQLVRQTELKDLDLAAGRIVYEVQYPTLGLTSLATLGWPMKEMTNEVFTDCWTVVYLYKDMESRACQLPDTIEIYRYSDGSNHRGPLINTYNFSSVSSGQAVYTDQRGRSRTIDVSYFCILSGGL